MNKDEIQALRRGDARAVARAISAVERGGTDARAILQAIYRFTGSAHVIGITGAPGTGKSTLANAIGQEYRRRGKRVGIIAIDPTSPFTGGALLGDRLRMQDLSGDAGVFIRSMATRGHLGGLAESTANGVQVLDAAGFDIVMVETVGAGQNEVEIAKNAHTTIVIDAPGLGDDIQAIKAGIIEIADILVVNKADRAEADATVAVLEMNLNLKPREENEWRPPVLKTVATNGTGVAEMVGWIGKHREHLETNGLIHVRERARVRADLQALVQRELMARVLDGVNGARLDTLVDKVAARQMDVYSAAETLLHADDKASQN